MNPEWLTLQSLEERLIQHNSRIDSMSPHLLSPAPEKSVKQDCDYLVEGKKHDQLLRLLKQIGEKDKQVSGLKMQIASMQDLNVQLESLKSQVAELSKKNSQLEKALEVSGSKGIVFESQRTKSLMHAEELLTATFLKRDGLYRDLTDTRKELELTETQLADEVKLRLRAEERSEMLACQLQNYRKKSEHTLSEALKKTDEAVKDNDNLREELRVAVKTLQSCHDELGTLPKNRKKLKKLEEELKKMSKQLAEERQNSLLKNKEIGELKLSLDYLQKMAGNENIDSYFARLKESVNSLEAQLKKADEQLKEQEHVISAADKRIRRISCATKANLETLAEWLKQEFFKTESFKGEFIGIGVDQQKYWERLAHEMKGVHSQVLVKLAAHERKAHELVKAYGASEQAANRIQKADSSQVEAKDKSVKQESYKIFQDKVISHSQLIQELESKVRLVTQQNERLCYSLSEVKAVLKVVSEDDVFIEAEGSLADKLLHLYTAKDEEIASLRYEIDRLKNELFDAKSKILEDRLVYETSAQEQQARISELNTHIEQLSKIVDSNEKMAHHVLHQFQEKMDEVEELRTQHCLASDMLKQTDHKCQRRSFASCAQLPELSVSSV
mmetsp:Transcript_19817/g.36601  ORF Transcript_19817/g.36601 Transcript_19817/m.36601 type:complete len:615 (-) Transcript_19817:2294-4138(-)